MRNITKILLISSTTTLLAACNGGSSGGNSSGGGGNNYDTPQPQVYSAVLPGGGNLISTTNLYFSTSSNNIPLQFGVQNIINDTTVSFTVQATNSTTKTLQSVSLPTISPSQCIFSATNPQPCTITMDASAAPAGSYTLVPATTANLTPITITTELQSSFTLPDGTYEAAITGAHPPECKLNTSSETLVVSNGTLCVGSFCQPNYAIPVPSGSNPFAGQGYFSNVAWTGTVATLNWTPDGCPGVLAPNTFTKINVSGNSTRLKTAPLRGIRTIFSIQ